MGAQHGATPADDTAATTPATGADDTATTDDTTTPDDTDKPLGPGGEKALASEREARKESDRAAAALKKANADLQKQLQAFQDKDKTELEKLTEARDAAEKEAVTARREVLRLRIAAEKQVDAELLAGDDEEAMRAHADRLLAWRGDAKPPTPKPDRAQGRRGPVDIDSEIREAEAKGDTALAITLKNRKLLASMQSR